MDWQRECQRSLERSQARRAIAHDQKHGWWRGLLGVLGLGSVAGFFWLLAWLLE